MKNLLSIKCLYDIFICEMSQSLLSNLLLRKLKVKTNIDHFNFSRVKELNSDISQFLSLWKEKRHDLS